jgi:hypothetical protein
MLIPRNVQLQVINQLCQGQLPSEAQFEELEQLLPHFDEPWRSHLDRLLDLADLINAQERQRLIDGYFASWIKEGHRDLLRAAQEKESGFPSLAQLAEGLPPIRWLWPDWIPRGLLSLLGAVPGAGKSYLALDLARRVLAGDPFPDGAPGPGPGAKVIYVDAEAVPQLLNERVEAWGMDREQLYLMLPEGQGIIDLGRFADRDRLVEMAWEIRPALIVVDSLSSITSKGENSVEDVRMILAFLCRLVRDFDCGLLLIHHLRKRSPQPFPTNQLTADDFRGSSHIITMARSVMGLSVVQTGPEPDRNGPRRLEVLKTNLTRYPSALGVTFEPLEAGGVRLCYGDPPEQYKEPTTLAQAMDWLLETLEEAGEPVRPKRILELAEAAGYSRATVFRARQALAGQVVNTGGQRNPENQWTLAGMG